MRLRTWLAGLSMLAIAPAAEAQITYTFNGFFGNTINSYKEVCTTPEEGDPTCDYVVDQLLADHQLNLTFVINRVGPINSPGEYATVSCAVSIVTGSDPEGSNPSYGCQATQQFDPNGFGTGHSFISAQYEWDWAEFNTGGGGGAFFFFDPGAFLANGTYAAIQTTLEGDPWGSNDDGGEIGVMDVPAPGLYGSAGEGTLIVAGIGVATVPEPSTWFLMVAGLGMMIPLARRRRA